MIALRAAGGHGNDNDNDDDDYGIHSVRRGYRIRVASFHCIFYTATFNPKPDPCS